MKIQKNKVVHLSYVLRKDSAEGDVIEVADEQHPLVFLFGSGQLLPAFEANVEGLAEGEHTDFALKSEEAYGEINENAVVELSIDAFKVEGQIDREMIQNGKPISMKDNEGHVHQGIIQKVGLETVIVDFNHPMAGQNLHFAIRVVALRDATETEIEHGHVHGPGGHQH